MYEIVDWIVEINGYKLILDYTGDPLETFDLCVSFVREHMVDLTNFINLPTITSFKCIEIFDL